MSRFSKIEIEGCSQVNSEGSLRQRNRAIVIEETQHEVNVGGCAFRVMCQLEEKGRRNARSREESSSYEEGVKVVNEPEP